MRELMVGRRNEAQSELSRATLARPDCTGAERLRWRPPNEGENAKLSSVGVKANFVNDRDNVGTMRNVTGVDRIHSGSDRFTFQSEKLSAKNDRVYATSVRKHFVNDRDNLAPDRNAFPPDTPRSDFESVSSVIGRFGPEFVRRDCVNGRDNGATGRVHL